MMKPYRKWKLDSKIAGALAEWSVQNFFGGRGMGKEETEQMTRLGNMLGYNKSWWNILAKDARHGGDQFLTSLKNIMASQGSEQDKAAQASDLMARNFKRISQNAPLRLAYDAANDMKRRVNQIAGGQDLDHNEIHLLMNVLMNAHKGGNIPWRDLNNLWRGITGSMDGRGNFNQNGFQMAKSNDVHTPYHLLKSFFGIGGGIFSSPSNSNEIHANSEQLLKQLDPDEYNRLFQAKFGSQVPAKKTNTPQMGQTPQQPGQAPQPGQPQQPSQAPQPGQPQQPGQAPQPAAQGKIDPDLDPARLGGMAAKILSMMKGQNSAEASTALEQLVQMFKTKEEQMKKEAEQRNMNQKMGNNTN